MCVYNKRHIYLLLFLDNTEVTVNIIEHDNPRALSNTDVLAAALASATNIHFTVSRTEAPVNIPRAGILNLICSTVHSGTVSS